AVGSRKVHRPITSAAYSTEGRSDHTPTRQRVGAALRPESATIATTSTSSVTDSSFAAERAALSGSADPGEAAVIHDVVEMEAL
ncbi:MAG: hypothetical protein V3V01_06005, partial [Acidimicrobiales bacterium]